MLTAPPPEGGHDGGVPTLVFSEVACYPLALPQGTSLSCTLVRKKSSSRNRAANLNTRPTKSRWDSMETQGPAP